MFKDVGKNYVKYQSISYITKIVSTLSMLQLLHEYKMAENHLIRDATCVSLYQILVLLKLDHNLVEVEVG